MRSKSKRVLIFLVILLVTLSISACAATGLTSTLFNLPSIPLRVLPDGRATIYGLPAGPNPVFPLNLLEQLQAANVQKLETRIGSKGVYIYSNGKQLPYVAWDDDSVATLQEVIRQMPNLPNAADIAELLPSLRSVGTGVTFYLPPAEGQEALNIPDWEGETTIEAKAPEEPTLGPFVVGSLAFDESGNATIEGVPAADLGVDLPQLDADTLGLLQGLGADQIDVSVKHDGLKIMLGDKPLPNIIYNDESLQEILALADPMLDDPDTMSMLNDVVPILSGADINLNISLTGEPVKATELSDIPLEINADGTLSAYGLALGSDPVLDPDMLASLQAANIQQLDVNVVDDSLVIGTNGQKLPSLSWNSTTLDTLAKMAPVLGLPSATLEGGMEIVSKLTSSTDMGLSLNLPLADGATALDIPEEMNMEMLAPDLGDTPAPVIHLDAAFSNGQLTSIAGIDSDELSSITLPPDVADLLTELEAGELKIKSEANSLNVMVDGETMLALNYDTPSLMAVMDLAAPMMEGTMLEEELIQQFVIEQILPLIPGADVDVTVALE